MEPATPHAHPYLLAVGISAATKQTDRLRSQGSGGKMCIHGKKSKLGNDETHDRLKDALCLVVLVGPWQG
jgi:hypothetical protein